MKKGAAQDTQKNPPRKEFIWRRQKVIDFSAINTEKNSRRYCCCRRLQCRKKWISFDCVASLTKQNWEKKRFESGKNSITVTINITNLHTHRVQWSKSVLFIYRYIHIFSSVIVRLRPGLKSNWNDTKKKQTNP